VFESIKPICQVRAEVPFFGGSSTLICMAIGEQVLVGGCVSEGYAVHGFRYCGIEV
jgi:hypothetical protein